ARPRGDLRLAPDRRAPALARRAASVDAPGLSLAAARAVGRVNAARRALRRPPEDTMRYLLTIYDDESGWNDATPEQVGAIMAAYDAFGEKVKAARAMLGGEGLQTPDTATTVRIRDGETITT